MPKLLIFAPCEKVLRDTGGAVSLISLVERIEARVPKDVPLPPALPFRLETISIWSIEPSEVGQYEERAELAAEGAPASIQTEPMILGRSGPGAKIVAPLDLIPAVDGRLEFRLCYRKIGDSEWTLAATYPVQMVLIPQ